MTSLRSTALAGLVVVAFSARAEEGGEDPPAATDKEPEARSGEPRRRLSQRGRSRKERKELDSNEERAAQPAPEPPAPEPARAHEPRSTRDPADRWRFVLRVALMLPNSGEWRNYRANALLGVSLTPPARNGSKVAYELGLDFGGWGESDGYESSLLGGRVDVLFPFFEGRAYALSGVGAFAESVKDVYRDERHTNTVAALDVGGGYVFGRHLDARFAYSVWLGSENLTGQALMSVGYCF